MIYLIVIVAGLVAPTGQRKTGAQRAQRVLRVRRTGRRRANHLDRIKS